MARGNIFLILICISMSACATTAPSLTRISEKETTSFIEKIDSVSDSDMKLVDTTFGIAVGRIDWPENEWIQPLNKVEKCTVRVFGGERYWEDGDFQAYWDGDCRQGRAYGVGRTFQIHNGELSSTLETYQLGNSLPVYHLDVNYDLNTVSYHGIDNTAHSARSYSYESASGEKRVALVDMIIDDSEKRIFRRTSRSGDDISFSSVDLPNGYQYVRSQDINPIRYSTEWGIRDRSQKNLGYSVGVYQNQLSSNIVHTKFRGKSSVSDPVKLPESYLNHISDVHNGVDSKYRNFEQSFQSTTAAISIYKRRICKGDVAVDYIDNEIYGRICLENGELDPFQAVAEKNLKAQEIRHENDRATINRQIAQRNQNQQIAAAKRARDVEALNQSLNNFSESMRQATNDIRNNMNSYQPPEVNFGQTNESTTTCSNLGSSIIQCKTQY